MDHETQPASVALYVYRGIDRHTGGGRVLPPVTPDGGRRGELPPVGGGRGPRGGEGGNYRVDYRQGDSWYTVYATQFQNTLGVWLASALEDATLEYRVPAGLFSVTGEYRLLVEGMGVCEFTVEEPTGSAVATDQVSPAALFAQWREAEERDTDPRVKITFAGIETGIDLGDTVKDQVNVTLHRGTDGPYTGGDGHIIEYQFKGAWYTVYDATVYGGRSRYLGEEPEGSMKYLVPAGLFQITGTYRIYVWNLGYCEFTVEEPLGSAVSRAPKPEKESSASVVYEYDATTGKGAAGAETNPNLDKKDAYSFVKAPRYDGEVIEVGPAARMWVANAPLSEVGVKMLKEKFGIEARTIRDLGWDKVFSIMGRHVARAEEALLIANAVEGWLKEVKPDGETFTPFEIPQSAEGYGCTEAPRGSLVHYIRVKDQKIDSYQIISATLWNCSPRDDKGRRGPLEEALIGVQVPDINNPVNVGRTIRAFDP